MKDFDLAVLEKDKKMNAFVSGLLWGAGLILAVFLMKHFFGLSLLGGR